MRDDGGWDIFFRFFIDANACERTNAQNILDWDWDWERLEGMVSDQLKSVGLGDSVVPRRWRPRIPFFLGMFVT